MPLAGFEPAIPAGNRLQTYVLDGNRVSTVDNRHLGLRYEIRLWPIYLFILFSVICSHELHIWNKAWEIT